MLLLINDIEFRHFNNIDVQLSYECVASSFSADLLFDPDLQAHRVALRPDAYNSFQLYNDEGQLLITGTILRVSFVSNSGTSWAKVSGYSKTGVLEDCEIPQVCYPLQTNAMSLRQICERICSPFGVNVVVDSAVIDVVDAKITKSTAKESQTAKSYLSELCSYRNVVLSHTPSGELLLTRANTKQDACYFFDGNAAKEYTSSLDFNGQQMHSDLGAIRQAYKRKGGGLIGQSTIKNPYVTTVMRTAVKVQKSGDNYDDTATTVRTILSDELRGITLKIEILSHYLNDKFVIPGMLISIQNPDLYLFKPTLFFIESVGYKSNTSSDTTTLTCYVPEVYNSDEPINIFQ